MIHVYVNPLNPGSFLAACGLMDLVALHDPHVLGVFAPAPGVPPSPSRMQFTLTTNVSLANVLGDLSKATFTLLDTSTDPTFQIVAPRPLTLNWFRRPEARFLKAWGGNMVAAKIVTAMAREVGKPQYHHPDLFQQRAVLRDGAKPVASFIYDAEKGTSYANLDVGFSADAAGIRATTAVAMELLCFIGLQRACPVRDTRPGRSTFSSYHTWDVPLPATLRPAAMAGVLPACTARFSFEAFMRTEYLKLFRPARMFPITR